MDHTLRALRHQTDTCSAPVEVFLQKNECKFYKFLKDFTDVPDFHDKLQVCKSFLLHVGESANRRVTDGTIFIFGLRRYYDN